MSFQLLMLNNSLEKVATFKVFGVVDEIKPSNEAVLDELDKLKTSFVALEDYRVNISNIYSEDVVLKAITLSAKILKQYVDFDIISSAIFYDSKYVADNELNECEKNFTRLLKDIRDFIVDCNDPNNVTKYRSSEVDNMKEEED